MGYKFKSMKKANVTISEACQTAKNNARRNFKCVRFRGASLVATVPDGERGGYHEPFWYSGICTRKIIEEVITMYDAIEIWYVNGLDGADDLHAFTRYDEYEPHVEDIEVLLWEVDKDSSEANNDVQ